MKMYMVRRTDYALSPMNMMGTVDVALTASTSAVYYFKCWHRKRLAVKYIQDVCASTGQSPKLFSVVTLESK